MEEEVVIRVENLKKKYRLGTIDGSTFVSDVKSLFARHRKADLAQNDFRYYRDNQEYWALKGLSFDIHKGETLGVIGANGAGKSTFLKILSRVTEPTTGTVKIKGRVTSMLEVGTGFHGELTGRENCYLNGAICGMSKADITRKMSEIIEFSEIGDFIDTPVKRYSSGMYVKLAFSVAAHLDSEIMIMDEVLAVGDLAFQNKCLDKMRNLAKEEGRTVLYVSHNMSTIRNLCNQCVILDQGELVFHGDTDEAIQRYAKGRETRSDSSIIIIRREETVCGEAQAMILGVDFMNVQNNRLFVGDDLEMFLFWKAGQQVSGVRIRCTFTDKFGNHVASGFSEPIIGIWQEHGIRQKLLIHSGLLAAGEYDCSVALFATDTRGEYIEIDEADKIFSIQLVEKKYGETDCHWDALHHGQIRLPDIEIL